MSKEVKLNNGIAVKGAVLPSIDDVQCLPDEVLAFPEWWVDSPSTQWYEQVYTREVGDWKFDFMRCAFDETGFIRPALIIDAFNSKLKFLDKFQFMDKEFIIISHNRALCTESVMTCIFIESEQVFKINKIEVQSIQEYLDAWYDAEADTQKVQEILASNAEKTSIILEDDAIVVKRALLLSSEEASELPKVKLNIGCLWWLRSPGYYENEAMFVKWDGFNIGFSSDYVNLPYGVRPALVIDIKSSSFGIGDTFQFGELDFEIISDNKALCKTTVGVCAFREDYAALDANDYIVSDIRKYVNDWYQCVLKSSVSQVAQKNVNSIVLEGGFTVTGATLLPDWEVEKLNKETRILKDETWWLCSPGVDRSCAAIVDFNGGIKYGCIVDATCSIRPALVLSEVPSTFKVGSKFWLGGEEFELISDTYALCTRSIGMYNFRKDWEAPNANSYAVSDIKRVVDKWYKEVTAPAPQPQKEQEVRYYTEEEVTTIVRDIPFSSIRNCESADEIADLIASMLRESRR